MSASKWYKKVAGWLIRAGQAIDFAFARPKQLDLPPFGTPYYLTVDSKLRLTLGVLMTLLTPLIWTWLAYDARSEGQAWAAAIMGANVLLFVPPLYMSLRVVGKMLYYERMRIGDVADLETTKLAKSLFDQSKKRKVPMTLISRGDMLYAYFRNDEDMVLIRAAS